MALIITIAGTDRTRLIDPKSLRITNVLTKQVDSCSFTINKFGSRSFAPSVGQEVIITQDGTKIFGGRVVTIDQEYDKVDFIGFKADCVDYTRDLDRRLVIDSYEDQTIDAIIADIQSNYLDPDITIANVDCSIQVKYIAFNYEYPSKCLQQLAELVNYDWYIDYNKDIHFFAKEANAAPFELSDTSGKYIYETLKIRRDNTLVRNTIIIRGGEYLGNTFTVDRSADGIQHVFGTEYKFADLVVTVTGQQKSKGIDPIDEGQGHDYLYNFNEKMIRFRPDKIPTVGSAVKIIGRPYLPVIVKLYDRDSIQTFSVAEGRGEYEYKIIDKSIKSKEGARQRAQAELLAYAATLSEGNFQTHQDGLKAGQRIRVQSTIRGLDEYFIINRVEGEVFDPATAKMLWRISLVTTKTIDYIELMQRLLTVKDKELTIGENEVLDEVEAAIEDLGLSETFTATIQPDIVSAETIGHSEVFTAQSLDYPVQFVLGPYSPPATTKRVFILNGSRLG